MFIEDMWPRSIINFEKYFLYGAMSHCAEKIRAEMRSTRFCDWTIHKKLKEAKTLYYACARGSSKSLTDFLNLCTLMAQGYDIKPMRAVDIPSIRRAAWTLRDKDILTPEAYARANDFCTTYLGDWVYRERVDHRPIAVRATSNPYGAQLHLYSQLLKLSGDS